MRIWMEYIPHAPLHRKYGTRTPTPHESRNRYIPLSHVDRDYQSHNTKKNIHFLTKDRDTLSDTLSKFYYLYWSWLLCFVFLTPVFLLYEKIPRADPPTTHIHE